VSDQPSQNVFNIVPGAISPPSFFQRMWPPAVLILALGLTLAWMVFLGCEFVGLIGMAL